MGNLIEVGSALYKGGNPRTDGKRIAEGCDRKRIAENGKRMLAKGQIFFKEGLFVDN